MSVCYSLYLNKFFHTDSFLLFPHLTLDDLFSFLFSIFSGKFLSVSISSFYYAGKNYVLMNGNQFRGRPFFRVECRTTNNKKEQLVYNELCVGLLKKKKRNNICAFSHSQVSIVYL